LDQHRNTPNPTGKKIKKTYKQDLEGKEDFHITGIRKYKRVEKVNSFMTCTNKGYYGHTKGLCGSRIQCTKGKLNKKECDHNKGEILQVKKEKNKKAG
jgi:hypothetical protein